ncbi:hypothetical protein [Leifsonia aquatica]|uniref:hypothetical protein n=1 Tax=Leifsonia aquatica TaxID=144185 RepID=UPI00046AFA46|nr:hypothetical protein [Leifsonia aquatica]
MTRGRPRLLTVMMLVLGLFALLAVAAVLTVGAIGVDRRAVPPRIRRRSDGEPALDEGVFTATTRIASSPLDWPL